LKSKAVILAIIFIIGIAIAYLMMQDQYGTEIITIGSPVPDVELIDTNQNKLNIAELKGSVVLINFWATWCEPCIDELPSMEILFRRFSANPHFKFISILFKDDRQKVLRFMGENGYTFPVYVNPDGSAAKKFGITGVPETFIIDKKGVLREKKIGPEQWDSPIIMEMLQSMIHET
jgi:DsbE subfamily thiol:disulfide oxidoreductase